MRAFAGPAMLLVMFGALAAYRLAGSSDSPARSFTELELAAADSEHTGTCYALSTVLIANGVNGNTVRTWSRPDKKNDDEWQLMLEDVVQGSNGPVHVFQKFRFARHGEQLWLTGVDASEGIDTDVAHNIDRMLEGPHGMNSTPVDRCRGSGARGYKFSPKN
jgi:hypothetical protein